jgi:hypothetical protein
MARLRLGMYPSACRSLNVSAYFVDCVAFINGASEPIDLCAGGKASLILANVDTLILGRQECTSAFAKLGLFLLQRKICKLHIFDYTKKRKACFWCDELKVYFV